MGNLAFKVEKGYVSAIQKMFGTEVEAGKPFEIEYTADLVADEQLNRKGTATYAGKFSTQIEVSQEEIMPFLFQFKVKMSTDHGEGVVKENEFSIAAQRLGDYEIAKKVFMLIMSEYREKTTRSRTNPEDAYNRKLAKIVGKFINRGASVEDAVAKAKEEMEAKNTKVEDTDNDGVVDTPVETTNDGVVDAPAEEIAQDF